MRYIQAFIISSIIFIILAIILKQLQHNTIILNQERVIKVVSIKEKIEKSSKPSMKPTKEIVEKRAKIATKKPIQKPIKQLKPIKKEKHAIKKRKNYKKIVKPKLKTQKISPKKISKTKKHYKYKNKSIHKQRPKRVVKKDKYKQQSSQIRTQAISQIKSSFLNSIRAKIKSNLTYPQRALASHIEGEIEIIFNISPNGYASNIRFLRAKRVFRKSVKKAFNKVFPVNIPSNIQQQTPFNDIYLPLRFKINN